MPRDTVMLMLEFDTSGNKVQSTVSNIGLPTFVDEVYYKDDLSYVTGTAKTSDSTYDYYIAVYDSNLSLVDTTWYYIDSPSQEIKTTQSSDFTYITGTFSNGTNDEEIRALAFGHRDFCLGNNVASFSFMDNGDGNYSFTNTSIGNYSLIDWQFGDGNTSSISDPNHTFVANGNYVVALAVAGEEGQCVDYFTDTLLVTTVTSSTVCNAGFTMYTDPTLFDGLTVVNSSTGNDLTYLWDFGDGNTSTLENPSHTYDTSGPFHLCLSIDDGNGCADMYCDSIGESEIVFRDDTGFSINVISLPNVTSINDKIESNQAVDIYPNPTSSQLSIVSDLQITEIDIVDISGKTIMTIEQNTGSINIADLPAGVYLIKLVTDKKTITRKLIKQ